MESYFLTYGRGAFKFVKNELNSKFTSNLINQLDESESTEGKFYFELFNQIESNNHYDLLMNLKTCERVFISLLFFKLTNNTNETMILNLISDSLTKSNLIKKNLFQQILDSNKTRDNSLKRIDKSIKYRLNIKLRGTKWKQLKREHLATFIQTNFERLYPKFEKNDNTNETHFDLICHLNDICLVMGIPLSQQALSKRSYLEHIGLRPTTCACMLQLISQSSLTFCLDPFCGVSTILSELLHSLSNKNSKFVYISSDSNINQLKLSNENLINSPNLYSNLICAKLNTCFPYKSNLFDLIISDLPFGKNYSIETTNLEEYYRVIMSEFERILVSNGCLILLINKTHLGWIKNECANLKFNIESTDELSLGETNAYLIKINKID